jgi:glycosyltransferase involved in cell wall biosynthesis
MKIVVYSPAFHPKIGGLEEVAKLCSLEFQSAGHEVTVLTETALGDCTELPLRVIRQFTFCEAFALTRSCDVFVEFNISLKGMIFPLLLRKPVVISHQSWFSDIRRPPTWRARLKHLATKFATNIACSHAVKDYVGGNAVVIPNAYDEHTFRVQPDVVRDQDLLFVGRLVSDKGCALLLDAIGMLKREGLSPTLTIVGSGPEQDSLAYQTAQLGLDAQIRFTGPLRGDALAREINRHRFLVVPSLWAEPFGIVALEGIACGCRVIGSEDGGLKDAVGPCGVTFPNGDSDALARVLKSMMTASPLASRISAEHLALHTSKAVGAAYLNVIEKVRAGLGGSFSGNSAIGS